ncbi:MAG TPA: hypothetical protein VMN03_16670, partial [Burkholderiales bacterium]|nr:hypothetical protein [Burkholderiales bacterium]
MTLLAEVVRTSTQVAGESSRLAKIRSIADCLRRLEPEEADIAIAYLGGETRQGKLALGHSTLRSCMHGASAASVLTLQDVDAAFAALKSIKGKGSAGRRAGLLRELFAKGTAEEQD